VRELIALAKARRGELNFAPATAAPRTSRRSFSTGPPASRSSLGSGSSPRPARPRRSSPRSTVRRWKSSRRPRWRDTGDEVWVMSDENEW